MKRSCCFLLLLGLGLVSLSCSKRRPPSLEKIQQTQQIAHLPKTPIPLTFPLGGPDQEVVIQEGEIFSAILHKFYGEFSHAQWIATYNHLENINNILAGTKLRFPSIETLFLQEKRLVPLMPELNQVLQAFQLYQKEKQEIEKIAYSSRDLRSKGMPFSDKSRQSLKEAAALMEDASEKLKQKEPSLPKRVFHQMESIVRIFSTLSDGKCDPECYELATLYHHYHFFTEYLIGWEKGNG